MLHAVACEQRHRGKGQAAQSCHRAVIELQSVPTIWTMWETAIILAVIVALVFAFGAIRLD